MKVKAHSEIAVFPQVSTSSDKRHNVNSMLTMQRSTKSDVPRMGHLLTVFYKLESATDWLKHRKVLIASPVTLLYTSLYIAAQISVHTK